MANFPTNTNGYFSSHQLVNLFANSGANMYAPPPVPDVFSALRRNVVVSVCPDCNDVSTPIPHGLKCDCCDKEYEGEVVLKKVIIAGEEIVVSVQEGKCSSCGCHNMDRILAISKCSKCGCEAIHYMSKHRPNDQYVTTTQYDHTSPGTAADWIPYVTIGTPTTYDMTSTSASTMYTCQSA